MKPVIPPSWPLTEQEALTLQRELASKIISAGPLPDIRYLAGVDVAYSERSDQVIAAVVVLEAASHTVKESAVVQDTVQFPYIPGLFSFRELPPVIKAFEQLKIIPDLVVCDGQGFAHPRRFGMASHLGVLFDVPTIGCGKTRLLGEYNEPGALRGSFTALTDQGETIGHVLRTQDGIKPVFISVGHRISLAEASEWIIRLTPRFRLPETTRQADQLVRRTMACIEEPG
ncbi:deoxyribonuclease V [Paenibacillus sp. y28]|uniref:deoxyribonuclease V n=1 Tax=Paenibacillus sp. y28 TaxID=3129110 RepID=UPI00301A975A